MIPFVFLSSNIIAATAAPEVDLGGIDVLHVSEPGTVNTEELSLDKLNFDRATWRVICDYSVTGPSKKTDVTIQGPDFNAVYLIASNEEPNEDEDNQYYDDGITVRQGKLYFEVNAEDYDDDDYYDNARNLVIKNYDGSNDLTLSQCKAQWLRG